MDPVSISNQGVRPRILSREGRWLLVTVLLAGVAFSAFLLGVGQAGAQGSTPTPGPTEYPLVPTPMALPEEPAGQAPALMQEPEAATVSGDIIISAELEPESRPVIAVDDVNASHLVIWQDRTDAGLTNVYARYLDPDGDPLVRDSRLRPPDQVR